MSVIVVKVMGDDVVVVVVVCIKLENELFPLFFFWGSFGTGDELLDSRRCVDRPTLCPSPVHPTVVTTAVRVAGVVAAAVVLALHRNRESQKPVTLLSLTTFALCVFRRPQ